MKYVPVIADNRQQFFYDESISDIGRTAFDSFINENRSKEFRYTDGEVCEMYDISLEELNRIKQSYAPDSEFYEQHYSKGKPLAWIK